jgi:hypothetical protein
MVLAHEALDARSLADVADDQLTDELLAGIWAPGRTPAPPALPVLLAAGVWRRRHQPGHPRPRLPDGFRPGARGPTPGGVAAVEAVLIAGLTAVGVDKEIAVPSVFLFRLATFWLPVLPGWLAFHHLTRRGML